MGTPGRSIEVPDESFGALSDLITTLDRLGPRPAMDRIHRALAAGRIVTDDLRRWIREDPRRYHRERVVRRDGYELLVMTWRSGQASPAHDHGGSICAMRVVQGTAVERSYQLHQDGYVTPVLDQPIAEGATVSGDDAAIHSVHNEHAGTLVTVHVYAPPLGDFRRFEPRGTGGTAVQVQERCRSCVAVIGGGFAGTATAVQLLRMAAGEGLALDVHLIERRGTVGEGIAYGTRDASHLLNVPAGNMSALADDPGHFVRWLAQAGHATDPAAFVPRMHYGPYMRSLIHDAARAPTSARLHLHLDQARRVRRDLDGGWFVHLQHGPSMRVDAAVLAVGHRPPADPIGDRWSGSRERWLLDPWRPHAVADIASDEPVAIIGSGLTAVDAFLSLTDGPGGPRPAPICMVSRNGRLPCVHASPSRRPANLDAGATALLGRGPVRIREVLGWFRGLLDPSPDGAAVDWREVVDGLRPWTRRIWAALPFPERGRFLRHLRALWEIHRHRMAPQVGARIAAAMQDGSLRLIRGHVSQARAGRHGVTLDLESASGGASSISAAWVLNCTGPGGAHLGRDADPAIRSMLEAGLAAVDPLGLGLETDEEGRVLDAMGRVHLDAVVVGTLRKPALWETTAVPELRVQAAEAATAVMRCIRGRGVRP